MKMNAVSNLSDSEFSIGNGFVKFHDVALAELAFAINSNKNQLKSKRDMHDLIRPPDLLFIFRLTPSPAYVDTVFLDEI